MIRREIFLKINKHYEPNKIVQGLTLKNVPTRLLGALDKTFSQCWCVEYFTRFIRSSK